MTSPCFNHGTYFFLIKKKAPTGSTAKSLPACLSKCLFQRSSAEQLKSAEACAASASKHQVKHRTCICQENALQKSTSINRLCDAAKKSCKKPLVFEHQKMRQIVVFQSSWWFSMFRPLPPNQWIVKKTPAVNWKVLLLAQQCFADEVSIYLRRRDLLPRNQLIGSKIWAKTKQKCNVLFIGIWILNKQYVLGFRGGTCLKKCVPEKNQENFQT